jgi:hypothetical protein
VYPTLLNENEHIFFAAFKTAVAKMEPTPDKPKWHKKTYCGLSLVAWTVMISFIVALIAVLAIPIGLTVSAIKPAGSPAATPVQTV